MKRIFEVENVKCSACAATLKRRLEPVFGEVVVRLDTSPRKITLELDDTQIDTLRNMLRTLGYPLSTDVLGLMEQTTTKVKSFVSCAVGKIEGEEC